MGKWGPRKPRERPPILKRRGEVSGVNDVIDGYLADKSLFKRGKERVVALVWADIVGPWFAQQTCVTKTERGVVNVHCDTAAVAQELSLRKSEIIARLNERLGTTLVKEVRASSGGLRRTQTREVAAEPAAEIVPSEDELELVALSREEQARIEAISEAIEDPALRARYCKSAGKAVKLERWKKLQGYAPCAGCGVLVKDGFGGYCTACWAQMLPEEKEKARKPKVEVGKQRVRRARRLGDD